MPDIVKFEYREVIMQSKIGVLGSINLDLVCNTDNVPLVGQTVLGKSFQTSNGGKGANEAVAISRLDGNAVMFGCVGNDEFGKSLIQNLKKEKVDIKQVKQLKMNSGIAMVTINKGNNSIIVVPGSNAKVDEKYVDSCAEQIKKCAVVGSQFEIDLGAVLRASEICKENNIPFVLNPSPVKKYPQSLFNNASYVVVNEIEVKSVKGYSDKNPLEILRKYPNKLILTLGGEGCKFFDGNEIVEIPAIEVDEVDTTGAGDTFMGAFMLEISKGKIVKEAISFANICAGLKTTKEGAQTGMPTIKEVEKYVKKNNVEVGE